MLQDLNDAMLYIRKKSRLDFIDIPAKPYHFSRHQTLSFSIRQDLLRHFLSFFLSFFLFGNLRKKSIVLKRAETRRLLILKSEMHDTPFLRELSSF